MAANTHTHRSQLGGDRWDASPIFTSSLDLDPFIVLYMVRIYKNDIRMLIIITEGVA